VENQTTNSCDSRIHAYKNGKTMEEYRQEAKKSTELLSEEISSAGEVSWKRVYYDIGNNVIPRIKSV
jgi:hypothetical protein